MDNGTIAWITSGAAVGGGLVGGLVSGVYQHWRDSFYGPKLKLDYGVIEAASIIAVKTPLEKGNLDEIYVKARLRNLGRRTAKRCIVYLSHIEEVHGSRIKATPFVDGRAVSWPLNDYKPRDIPPGLDFYVDLIKISKRVQGWRFGVEHLYASECDLEHFSGTFRFHLVVASENAKSTFTAIDVHYEQDSRSLRAFPSPEQA